MPNLINETNKLVGGGTVFLVKELRLFPGDLKAQNVGHFLPKEIRKFEVRRLVKAARSAGFPNGGQIEPPGAFFALAQDLAPNQHLSSGSRQISARSPMALFQAQAGPITLACNQPTKVKNLDAEIAQGVRNELLVLMTWVIFKVRYRNGHAVRIGLRERLEPSHDIINYRALFNVFPKPPDEQQREHRHSRPAQNAKSQVKQPWPEWGFSAKGYAARACSIWLSGSFRSSWRGRRALLGSRRRHSGRGSGRRRRRLCSGCEEKRTGE